MEIAMSESFNPLEYYKQYPLKVILRPGYPARAQYKALYLWKLYGNTLLKGLNSKIETYADIGGCFGFGANAMAFHISKSQGFYPKTKVFEIASDFVEVGKLLFPYVDFVQANIMEWTGEPQVFDLMTVVDVIEHIPDPIPFLSEIAKRCKFALLKTPMEARGDWFGAKPPENTGSKHPDGHVNFFTPKTYLKLLDTCGMKVVKGKFTYRFVPFGCDKVLFPEEDYKKPLKRKLYVTVPYFVPSSFLRGLIGRGEYVCLVQSTRST